jgi:hypothetical protein
MYGVTRCYYKQFQKVGKFRAKNCNLTFGLAKRGLSRLLAAKHIQACYGLFFCPAFVTTPRYPWHLGFLRNL